MIAFNGHNLTIDDVWRTAALQTPCSLADDARPRIRQSRALVESLAAQPRAVYGINTGFGKLASAHIGANDLALLQRNLVLSHAAGVGEPTSRAIVCHSFRTLR